MARNPGHVDGELAEFAVAADLVSKDCRVSYTHGEYKYDLVADHENLLLRVQVKKANQDTDDPWKYRLFTEQYEEGEVDLFAGHIVESGETFYATASEVGAEFTINTKSGEQMNEHNRDLANLVDEYTLERAISKLQERDEVTSGD